MEKTIYLNTSKIDHYNPQQYRQFNTNKRISSADLSIIYDDYEETYHSVGNITGANSDVNIPAKVVFLKKSGPYPYVSKTRNEVGYYNTEADNYSLSSWDVDPEYGTIMNMNSKLSNPFRGSNVNMPRRSWMSNQLPSGAQSKFNQYFFRSTETELPGHKASLTAYDTNAFAYLSANYQTFSMNKNN